MDSLLASYASSDEEDDQRQPQPIHSQPASNLFSSLPPPSSDSPSSASLFSKLPQPKSDPLSLNPKPKKVVQFRPPVITKVVVVDDDDDDDEDDKKEDKKKDDFLPQAPSVKSFLSSIPAPRNSGSLGAGLSSAGAGRRSILEAQVPGLSSSNISNESVGKSSDKQVKDEDNVNLSADSYDNSYNEYANVAADYGSYDYSGYQNVDTDVYGPGYEGNSGYGQYESSKWVAEIPVVQQPHGKRGRNEIPAEVIEVNQDELMKNRPRPDQAKLTGIAFGPSYQPTSSTKGKPSKLHKRKHQIGSLYFDMRSKEAELAERRSKGFLTKAETQAKYGW
ncbi:putative proline-rich protein PRCC [Helianthus anomalus]